VLGVLAAATLTAAAGAQSTPKVPVVVCPRVASAPTLDGRLDPGEWANAGTLSEFVTLGTGTVPRLPTHVMVMHTQQALYIGAQMDDDAPEQLVANVATRDGNVTEDDCLEIFIDTENSRKHYAHFAVNSLGTKFDEYDHDSQENFEWNVAASVNRTGWAVEIELPFDNAVAPIAGEKWVLGVCRNAAHAGELSSWFRSQRGFHEPENFGEMIFGAPLLTARIDDIGNQFLGDNLAMITVRNPGPVSQTIKANAVVMGDDRRSQYFGSVKKDLPPGSSQQLFVPYKVRRCDPTLVLFSVTDEKGTTAWRTAPVTIPLPPVSSRLDALVSSIALCWREWATLSASDAKQSLGAELEELQKEWRYLDAQMADAAGMPVPRLSALAEEALRLQERAKTLQERISAARGSVPLPRPSSGPSGEGAIALLAPWPVGDPFAARAEGGCRLNTGGGL
jgi:hypothetical protein